MSMTCVFLLFHLMSKAIFNRIIKKGIPSRCRRWPDMSPDILEFISDRLPLADYVRFRSVCKSWRYAPSGRSEITNFSKDLPWLMAYGSDGNSGELCYLYCHSYPTVCTVRLPHLRGATVLHSKFGWLIARCDEHFFLYNPLTFAKIDLPKPNVTEDQVWTFRTLPTNPSCTVLVASRKNELILELSSWKMGDKEWAVKAFKVSNFGRMKGAYCCSCSYDHSRCDCTWRNTIAVCDSEWWVYFDYATKKYVNSSRCTTGGKDAFWSAQSEMVGRCCRDWCRRLGKKGTEISVSGTISRLERSHWVPPWDYVHSEGDGEESGSRPGVLKAAYLEPKSNKYMK